MFTQKIGLNTNKCNGCNKLCILGAYYITRGHGKYRYLPTKNNKPITYSQDQFGNQRPIRRPYATPEDAIKAAKNLVQQCKSYKNRKITPKTQTPQFDRCIGCSHHCLFSSQKIQGIFITKIGSKLIKYHINTFGKIPKTPNFTDEFHAKMYAFKVAKTCDNYLIQR